MTPLADPYVRRGAGAVLIAVGTAAAIFALTAPGSHRAEAAEAVALGPGVRTLDVELASGDVRIVAARSGRAEIRMLRGGAVSHAVAGGVARLRCSDAACTGAALEVRVPAGTAVRARVDRGAVTVRGSTGSLDLGSRDGSLSVSLDKVVRRLQAKSVSGSISLTVPYAYGSDGYRVSTRTRGHLDLDITRVRAAGAPSVAAQSETGDILLTQRYPNMS